MEELKIGIDKQTKKRIIQALGVIEDNIDVLEEEEIDELLRIGNSINELLKLEGLGEKNE